MNILTLYQEMEESPSGHQTHHNIDNCHSHELLPTSSTYSKKDHQDKLCTEIGSASNFQCCRINSPPVPQMLSSSEHCGALNYLDLSTNYIREFTQKSIKSNSVPTTLVVIPSMDVDNFELQRIFPTMIPILEERQLYNLLLLRENPNLQIIYVTSENVSEHVVGYYLRLGTDKVKWREQLTRLHMLSANDNSMQTTLSQKILERPKLLNLLRELTFPGTPNSSSLKDNSGGRVHSKSNAEQHYVGLSVFTGSSGCSRLSRALGLPLLEADLAHLHWGTKQGSREIFFAAKVPFPRGTPDTDCGDYDSLLTALNDESPNRDNNIYNWEDSIRYIRSPQALSIGLARQILLKNVRPQRWMVKLNQGFCGKGNAILDLTDLQNDPRYQISEAMHSSHVETQLSNVCEKINALAIDIESRLPSMRFEDQTLTWDGARENIEHPGFCFQMRRLGVIAEELYIGSSDVAKSEKDEIIIRSPSFQGVIMAKDERCDSDLNLNERTVRMLSTHEQILNGLVFIGCQMPALDTYRSILVDYGMKIGDQLAQRGVIGHFSVDFLAIRKVRNDDSKVSEEWDIVAVEINLRQGGTTHPHAAMEILVGGGDIDKVDGTFKTKEGSISRYYVATDSFKDALLTNLTDADIIRAIENEDDPNARRLHWDRDRMTGTVFHLFKGLSEGRIGFTSIGASEEEAKRLFDSTINFVKQQIELKISNSPSSL